MGLVPVVDAPPFGLLRFDVVAGAGGPAAAETLEPLTITNEYLTVRVDPTTASIASIVENRTGRELVRSDAVVGFNGYVYDRYASAPRNNHLANKLYTSERLELLATRQLARPAVVLEHTADAVEQRIVYESAARAPTVSRRRCACGPARRTS
ncbi:hypothetical protein P9139_06060 [Curtobacterium flaccumfaciens]|nr:hypothetical protein P9139_06060 [Curtobacterium flaccumfaciens]